MMIFKKAIPRRTFLRGIGTMLALPMLDAMLPAFASAASPVKRLSIVYTPNGMIMDHWLPKVQGPSYELTPILEPLAPFREDFLVLSGLDHNTAEPLPGEGDVAPHERAGATFLTGVHPKREGVVGISVDQLIARELGQKTQLASLELGLDSPDLGRCENGWTCAFLHTLSWRGPTTPMPIEIQPRMVFERLFGDNNNTDPAARQQRLQEQRSLLDSVTAEVGSLVNGLNANDRAKIGEYLEAVRDVERRIQLAEDQSRRELPVLDRPAGIPGTFAEHAELMFDLQLLAFQSDLTRMITFMMGAEQSTRAFREIDIPDPHHSLSHHSGDLGMIKKVIEINIYHSKIFSYFLEKLRSTSDGDGSLLDNLMIVYGSCLSDGQKHLHQDLPLLLVGGRASGIRSGRHLRYSAGTPVTNLYLTLLDKLGMPTEHFGDSSGKLDLLSVG